MLIVCICKTWHFCKIFSKNGGKIKFSGGSPAGAGRCGGLRPKDLSLIGKSRLMKKDFKKLIFRGMEESLGPELINLLIEAYVSCVLEEFDELWLRTLHRLAALHAMEVEDGDSEEEEEFQEFLKLRMLLV